MNFNMQYNATERMQTGFYQSGAGPQQNNSGSGGQHNNSGCGPQYNATNINFGNRENDSFLADLRVTDPRDDKSRIQRTKGNLLKDSYRWILKHNDFCQWRAEKRLLWIKGGPGRGKTMLMCGVIDELVAMGYKSTFFFFCEVTDARLNTATSVLRGLLYLIVDQHPIILNSLRAEYDRAGADKQLFEDINGWEVLTRMLLSAVSHQSLRDVVLIVDALDECTSGLEQLVSFIIDLTAHAKVIVSSRLSLSIDRGLSIALEDSKIYLSLELNEDVISAAVNNYIRHKVHQLARLKSYDNELKTSVQEYLTENASSTFLWVALVYEQLADKNVGRRHTQRKLRAFPQGLDSLYDKILTQILQSPDAEECTEVLAVMSIVTRPLDLAELTSLIQNKYTEEIVEECSSLLMLREETVYFIHQSAKDFLLRRTDRIMPSGIAQSQGLVLSRLLQSMSNTLRRNIYDINEHGIPLEEICVPNPDPLRSVRYACVYWAAHLRYNTVGRKFQEVRLFITEHFLHWLEALSLLRSMSVGITSMYRIRRILEPSKAPYENKLLVQDAVRFIRYFRVPIEIDPLQVYSSALVFSPTKSIIRRLFSKEEPNWPLKPVADEDWSPCIQTLEGHGGYVNSVKFSPDQTMLASASNDRTVKLWDTTTGHCVRTLQTDGRAHSVTFSIDGITLAVASDAGIELWNTTTGRCTGRLSPHGRPSSVAFSSDGAILASGSNRNVAQLWNVEKGQCTHTLSGHSAAVLSVAFSGDGSLTASASHDTTVKIWQTATGVCIKTLYHQTSVRSVVISDNGDCVVSASFSGVKLFSVATGACFSAWKGGLMNGIAMSYDGARLAFEHDRNGVLVWDTYRKQILHILQGHDGPVTTLTFSKDGGLLASASIDASIKLWDLTIAQPRAMRPDVPEHRNLTITQPRIDTTHHKCEDTDRQPYPLENSRSRPLSKRQKMQQTYDDRRTFGVNRHSEKVDFVRFTSDGSRIISHSRNTLFVWDKKTGQRLKAMHVVEGSQLRLLRAYSGGGFKAAVVDGFRAEIRNGQELVRTLEFRSSKKGFIVVSQERSGHITFDDMPQCLDLMLKGVKLSGPGYLPLKNHGTFDRSGETSLSSESTTTADLTPQRYRYTREDSSWVFKDGRRFLWLPTEYRQHAAEIDDSTMVIGLDSGRVVIIRFS